jgi:hypothetical protein
MTNRRLNIIESVQGVPTFARCNKCDRKFRVPEGEALANPTEARDKLIEEFDAHRCDDWRTTAG